jgi:phosphatidylglycerophosphatase A
MGIDILSMELLNQRGSRFNRYRMKSFNKHLIEFLATGGWIGHAPVAPGTFGSLAALPLCWMLSCLSFGSEIVVMGILIGASIWISHAAEKMDSQDDPKHVVVDEICGMAVALSGLPFIPVIVIGAFALFRMFDIVKPFPIRWVDRKVPGGLGIMLDDILAGMLANMLLRLMLTLI